MNDIKEQDIVDYLYFCQTQTDIYISVCENPWMKIKLQREKNGICRPKERDINIMAKDVHKSKTFKVFFMNINLSP